jgi:ubiquinone/menaquinone biosynthesis C-methylase UbiE
VTHELELGPGRTVLDLGAGTGKLTRALVPTGARVIAVEPLDEMRAALERAVPGVESHAGTAEAIPLEDESVDAVTVAQAFHWFEHARALQEIRRVLRPGGRLGLVWNSRDLEDALQERLDDLLHEHRRHAPQHLHRKWRAAVDDTELFGDMRELAVPWEEPMTREGLADRVASVSVVAALPDDERAQLLDRVRALADDLDEPFPLRYRAELYVLPRL